MLICGIDEAGRGPLIGPMVVCGVLTDEAGEGRLFENGVKDSKLLTPERRDALAGFIKSHVKSYAIRIIPPREIDRAVETINLNNLEMLKIAEIIRELKPEKAIIDSPSVNTAAYKSALLRMVDMKIDIIVEHKAERHAVVAAASIIAKTLRDSEIERIKESIGIDFGSGYPADPLTRGFAEKNFNRYPDIFRMSWATYQRLRHKQPARGQARLSAFSEG